MCEDAKTTAEAGSVAENDPSSDRSFVIRWVFPDTSGALTTDAGTGAKLLGRDVSCDTMLVGDEVSRQHAELRRNGPLCVLRDLGSKNGVFVNGARVEQAVLAEGDVVRIGEWLGVAGEVPRHTELALRDLGGGLWGGFELSEVVERVRLAAGSELPVVIIGESGTGKERIAGLLHTFSQRPGPFLAVNCASYSAELAAAELFGHRQGAFTGANRARTGHIQAAEQGTLFLDEIADLPLSVQPQLLRVLEQREVLRLGESRAEPVDVRFVSAGQTPLTKLVNEGRFRADLRARLEGIVLTLPPLRERRGDVCSLFLRMLAMAGHPAAVQAGPNETAARVETRLMERLCVYDWPLNVRELTLVARRVATLLPNEAVLRLNQVEQLVPELRLPDPERSDAREPERRAARAYSWDEINALTAALNRHQGNLTRAAEELQITRQKAYRLLQASKEKASG